MNWLDMVIIAVLIISALSGLKTGIIKAVLSLAGVILGVILAGRYHEFLAQKLTFISPASMAKIVAFAIILVAVMIIAGILASVLKWAVSAVMLGWVNHLGGALLGLVFGAILCGALLAIWANFLGVKGTIAESALATILLSRFPMVLGLLPDEFDAIRSFFK